jgi:hypothetical protein
LASHFRQRCLAAVDQRHAAVDKAVFFQPFQALPARRGGEADLLRKLRHRQGAVHLQGAENGVIEAVKIIHA